MAERMEDTATMDLRDFFSAVQARIDRRRTLHRLGGEPGRGQ